MRTRLKTRSIETLLLAEAIFLRKCDGSPSTYRKPVIPGDSAAGHAGNDIRDAEKDAFQTENYALHICSFRMTILT
jgi:hypothetical protein